jgi:hypothetical protein
MKVTCDCGARLQEDQLLTCEITHKGKELGHIVVCPECHGWNCRYACSVKDCWKPISAGLIKDGKYVHVCTRHT